MSLRGTDPTLKTQQIAAPASKPPTALVVSQGRSFPPQQQILLYSADEWEEFIKEWVHYQKTRFPKVERFAGSGDLGVDVAGFVDDNGFSGTWECFQCKHYDDPLTPTIAFPEIAKILWYSFGKKYSVPQRYYFIAPKGCGQKLKKLLLDANKLKQDLQAEWQIKCANEITAKTEIRLEGDFLEYVKAFDFSIFGFKAALTIIDEHRATPYYAARFGGGLPDRPPTPVPPTTPESSESRYIQKLYGIYSEEIGSEVKVGMDLVAHDQLASHFDRQREFFYSAEALRNFARDAVPHGTFEELQSEVYAGVIDITQSAHPTSMTRLTEVTKTAAILQITSNGLISVTRISDRKGICHQLANDDRLSWSYNP